MVDTNYFVKKFHEWVREIFEYKYLILISLIIILVATFIDYLAGVYVSERATVNVVQDLILDHFGPYDLSFIFVWGFLILVFTLFAYASFFDVKKLHKVIAQFSFLIIIRSIFIILTHLKTPTDAIAGKFPWILHNLRFENDMFFSGHVAIPFLGFLLFKGNKIRYFFLIGSIIMAITVLAMHQHYSIDVFAAFFIVYGSYKIGEKLFEKVERIFKERY